MSGAGVAAKAKAEAEPGEMNRTRAAGESLSGKKRVAHTTTANKAKLSVLNAQRALKGVELQATALELDYGQARLRKNHGLDLVHWG